MRYFVFILFIFIACATERDPLSSGSDIRSISAPFTVEESAALAASSLPYDDPLIDRRVYDIYALAINGRIVLDHGRGLYALRYIYSEGEINCAVGYMLNGEFVLTGKAVAPPVADSISAPPTANDYNRLASRYNELVAALQATNIIAN